MRHYLLGLLAGGILALVIFPAANTHATPIYSLRSANQCNTCHIEPIGWYEAPEKKNRACTVDCQACHVNKTGGGLRTPIGRYYAVQTLPTFSLDPRPSAHANPQKYRDSDDTYSNVGRYRLWEGFSGWKAGSTRIEEIPDRLGYMDPDPSFSAGFDARILAFKESSADLDVFPMQADFHLWGRVHPHINIYGTVGLQGRRRRTINDITTAATFKELVTIRELVVEYDNIPWNGYVRAGRFSKAYGWRHPDHTLFTRRALGYGQFGQVYGIEAGINPNYPWANLSVYYQGVDAIPGDFAPPGFGASLTAGFRDLGWQSGGNFEALRLNNGTTLLTTGPTWGVTLYPVVILGELDFRVTLPETGSSSVSAAIYNEVNTLVYPGVTALFSHQWTRSDITINTPQRHRLTFGVQWDILAGIQLAAQYRLNLATVGSATQDMLLWTHVWY